MTIYHVSPSKMTLVRARATYYWENLVLVVDLVLESKGAFTLGSRVLVPEYDTRTNVHEHTRQVNFFFNSCRIIINTKI